MISWHHQVNAYKFEQTLGDSEGQGSLAQSMGSEKMGQKLATEKQYLNQYAIHLKLTQYCKSSVVLVAQLCPTLQLCGMSMEFSRQEYWSGLPFPSPGDLPDPENEPRSPALQADSLPSELPGNLKEKLKKKKFEINKEKNSISLTYGLVS